MIYIKNLKIFNCSINESFHWSKLPKMKKLMKKKFIKFSFYADLRGADKEKVEIKDFMIVQGLGSEDRITYIFNTEIGIVIKCGCFFGTEKEFKKKVKETHNKNQYAKEYTEMLKLVHIRFSRKDSDS